MSQDWGEMRVELLKKYFTHNIFYFVFVIKKKKTNKKQTKKKENYPESPNFVSPNRVRKMLHFEFGNFQFY